MKSIDKIGDIPESLPLLALRNRVVFPHMALPLYVGRERSVSAIETAFHGDGYIILVAQKDDKIEDPKPDDLYTIGVLASVIQLFRLQDGTLKTLVSGIGRIKISNYIQEHPYYKAEYNLLNSSDSLEPESKMKTLVKEVQDIFGDYVRQSKKLPPEIITALDQIDDPVQLANVVMGQFSSKYNVSVTQDILQMVDPYARLEKILTLLREELSILKDETKLKKAMQSKSRKGSLFSKSTPSREDGNGELDELKQEYQELEEKIYQKKLSDEARERSLKELRKLKLMAPMSGEATVVRNYIDWILSIPWNENFEEPRNIKESKKILDNDHWGMEKPKERILEHLAVQILSKKVTGPIICLTGPPGVGKTSLAKSVAHACGRKFVRLSLGGVKDEAEIRGHRRTYIGAMPGKIIQSIKKSGSSNPVFLLDEIDKLSSDFRGDPSSALLEVLDPEQNSTFSDHYIDLEYDLSKVLFIATANSISSIPWALQDRMEIIELDGYTEWEKLSIAKKYLVPKQILKNGLDEHSISFTQGSVKTIITHYTKEAGVRSLERSISSILRKLALEIVQNGSESVSKYKVKSGAISTWLGKKRYNYFKPEKKSIVGVVNGLAVTAFGGDLLVAEASVLPGKGNLLLTGKLGEVMQESARIAFSYIRSRSSRLGLDTDFYDNVDIHIHFPAGAIPKDGPSAGITIATAVVSSLLQIPVHYNVAMTGEITLGGRVLKIGGLKEKIIAAHRSGIKKIIIPQANSIDLDDIPARVLDSVTVVPVKSIDEVLKESLDQSSVKNRITFSNTPVDWRDNESGKL
jgi:ATP-dependent Lon protease